MNFIYQEGTLMKTMCEGESWHDCHRGVDTSINVCDDEFNLPSSAISALLAVNLARYMRRAAKM